MLFQKYLKIPIYWILLFFLTKFKLIFTISPNFTYDKPVVKIVHMGTSVTSFILNINYI